MKAVSVKEYAKMEGCKNTSTIYNRITRGTIKAGWIHGVRVVYPATDKTIKKPRKQAK